jgi:1-deoxy-D-xylulose-5-phosphate synthase
MELLAGEIRAFLVEKVSATGGHLGPNLGVVEVTLAIHRIFDSPRDVVLFDTGHQSYVHKIVTGRVAEFDLLRQRGGIAGYPSRRESVHDVIENSHASTSLSWADGISRGFALQGESDRSVVVVVGDGALTGGMAWEALNNIATAPARSLVIVVNDNERSYSPTVGGLARSLSKLRDSEINHPGIFRALGITYTGPIDGHDIEKLEAALSDAKSLGKPVVLHVVTEKGRGHQPAIDDDAEKFHAVGIVDRITGASLATSGVTWTSIFGRELAELGKERQDIVAMTAAMQGPTGLNEFQSLFPERTIDVGIAEQHAVTSAAGLSFAGLHPVVAIYSTFLNRAFDQLLLDVALHKAGVTFVLDRAGITGDDGPSHNGIWDLAVAGIVPSLHIAAPRDATRLKELLREAVNIEGAPSLVRFPKGKVAPDITAVRRIDGIDILREDSDSQVLLIAVGAMAQLAVDVAELLAVPVTVVDPRWVKPLSPEIVKMAAQYARVVVLEDGLRHGGIASSLSEELRERGIATPLHSFGVPSEFLEHAKRVEIMHDLGLTSEMISQKISEAISMGEKQLPYREKASHK